MSAFPAYSCTIHQIAEEERPRERLVRYGAETLSAIELIAIILGSGTKEAPVMHLAQEVFSRFGNLQCLSEATISELCNIKGIGLAKAIQLKAALSLGMRASKQVIQLRQKINHPSQVYALLKDDLQNEKREIFAIVLLDVKGGLICWETIAVGTLTNTWVHPREVFYPAIRNQAASIVVAHNHPSGDLTPSNEDLNVTEQLIEAGRLVGIPVNDHLIISKNGFISFRQKGFVF